MSVAPKTLIQASLKELGAALAARQVSSVELAQLFLERIQRLNPTLNAFITVDPEKTLDMARAADVRLAAGNAGPLTGIPLAHKDIFCAEGWLTTCGSKMLANFVSPYDAYVVDRLNAAGMVTLGKCNMDEFAMGSSNETSYYGPVKNPWDTGRVPGGSSGGSAAAIAARLAPAATAAAEPPLEPPGTRARSHGFLTGPQKQVSLDEPIANSSMLVLPRITAPAAFSRSTTCAS